MIVINLFGLGYTILITAFALSGVAVNVGSCIWRFLSSEAKKEIKGELGFGKTEHLSDLKKIAVLDSNRKDEEPKYTRLFTTCDHSVVIRKMNDDESKKYLLSTISKKLSVLAKNESNEKNQQKIEVLQLLEQVIIEGRAMPAPGKLHHKYPPLVDNFWCEKSDTQQLLDAVGVYCTNRTLDAEQYTEGLAYN